MSGRPLQNRPPSLTCTPQTALAAWPMPRALPAPNKSIGPPPGGVGELHRPPTHATVCTCLCPCTGQSIRKSGREKDRRQINYTLFFCFIFNTCCPFWSCLLLMCSSAILILHSCSASPAAIEILMASRMFRSFSQYHVHALASKCPAASIGAYRPIS